MSRRKLHSLKQFDPLFKQIDKEILQKFAERMNLSREVGALKARNGKRIIRRETENRRINQIKRQARSLGINPNFAAAIFQLIIGESCREQMQLREDSR